MTLSPDQDFATNEFLKFLMNPNQPEMILTAPPGRGKTFITKHMIQKARDMSHMLNHLGFAQNGLEISVNATTNKAAEVAESMLGTEVKTIHSKLGLIPRMNFDTWKEELVKTRMFKVHTPHLIIIDECGSIGPELFEFIRVALKNCKVLYIGDDAQTAPVGETNCPVFEAGIPTTYLTTNHRNGGAIGDLGDVMRETVYQTAAVARLIEELKTLSKEDKVIPQSLSNAISEARSKVHFPSIVANGVDIIRVDGEEFEQMVHDDYRQTHSSNELKIIAWRNELVREYNDHVRTLYTNSDILIQGERVITNKAISLGGCVFASTDSILTVMKVSGDTTVEGVIGNWITVDGRGSKGEIRVFQAHDLKDVKALLNHYYNQRMTTEYNEAKETFVDLRPTHSCTVHKSQGSTYGTVYLNLEDIGSCRDSNAVARMLNTGITRAKDRLVIYGDLPECYGG